MKAIVKSVEPNGTYDSQYGLMYKYKVTIGEHTGEYSSKKYQTSSADGFPFQVDSEAEYEFVDGQYPKIKTVQSGSWGGGKKTGSNASFALSYSKDLVVADKVGIEQILIMADKFNKWLNDN